MTGPPNTLANGLHTFLLHSPYFSKIIAHSSCMRMSNSGSNYSTPSLPPTLIPSY